MSPEIDLAWSRIETWYEAHLLPRFRRHARHATLTDLLYPGATEQQIAEAETRFGRPFPAEFRASLKRHDGAALWPGGEGLPPLEEAWTLTESRRHALERFPAEGQPSRDGVEQVWWHSAWWSFERDGGGNGTALDLQPAPCGHPGQVIGIDHETADRPLLAMGLALYLSEVADLLEAGWYVASEWLAARDTLDETHKLYAEDLDRWRAKRGL
ncbi:SMI1/KNR4 family protein [Deinococcus oregonensis]|uniref:SMI1/KNR4 family protein n=1 Tax=Deinococcus oregonensis TaxID=1805970 RepID=A0ABV6B2S8_9DEIO